MVTKWETLAAKKESELRICYKQIDALKEELAAKKKSELQPCYTQITALEEELARLRQVVADRDKRLEDQGRQLVQSGHEAEERRKREKRELAEELEAKAKAQVQAERDAHDKTVAAIGVVANELASQEEELTRLRAEVKDKRAAKSKALQRLNAKYDKELARRKGLEEVHRVALARERELLVRNGELEISLVNAESEIAAAELHYAALTKTNRESAVRSQGRIFALETALFVLGTELNDEDLVDRLLTEAGRMVDCERKKAQEEAAQQKDKPRSKK